MFRDILSMKPFALLMLGALALLPMAALGQDTEWGDLLAVPEIHCSWDDLTNGIETKADWDVRRQELKRKYLKLLRDEYKPQKPALDLKVHEEVIVDGLYRRQLISYAVEADERAHAYLGIPLELAGKAPAIVALHGTYEFGAKRAAGLIDNPDKAYLDHLCRRGYVVIAPEHFVSGHRVPPEGPYETGRFYKKHPQWTAVGKFTYEHSIAIDVLQSLEQVDGDRIGALGHSLGTGPFFWLPTTNGSRRRRATAVPPFFATIRTSSHGRAIIGMCTSSPSVKGYSAVNCRPLTFTRSLP